VEKFEMILDNLTTAVYIFQNNKFVYVNKAMQNLTGYTEKELLSINYLELIDFPYREWVKRLTEKVLSQGTDGVPLRPRFVGVRKNGEKVWVENIPRLIKYRGKVAILGNLLDITEEKKMEERIEALCEFYRKLGRAVNLSATIKAFCRRVIEAFKYIIDYDMADILIYDEEKDILRLCIEEGYPEDLKEHTVKEQKLGEKKVAAFCALRRKPVYIKNMKKHPLTGYVVSFCEKYNLNQMYTVPLISKGGLEGVLQVIVRSPKVLSEEDRKLIDIVCEEIAAGISKIKAEQVLRELSQKDYLTGLYNYQRLWKKLEEQKDREKRYKEVYSVIYIDIDNFKSYNDTFGHLEGDKILKKMGELLRSSIRKVDSAYRYGGEEFVILLPYTEKKVARKVAERIKEEVEKNFSFTRITVSMGVTDSRTNEDVIKMADEAMYEAKKEGKDRIKVI